MFWGGEQQQINTESDMGGVAEIENTLMEEEGETSCEPPYSACHCQLGGKGRVNTNAKINVFSGK